MAFGYNRADVLGHTFSELNVFYDQEDLYNKRVRLDENQTLYNYELPYRTINGETRMGLASSETLNMNGMDCFLHTMIDITANKELEANIARLDRLNLIGEMAASIGHEIRNPMTAVRGFIQLLKQQEYYAKDEVYFDLMIEELDRANGIISEYLGMAKDKRIELQPQYLDEIAKSLYPLIQAEANRQEMDVKLELGKPPMPIIDANEIRQLILNMARNGIEAMLPGGMLTIGTTLENDEIILFIKDEGQGLPLDILDKIGTPFVSTKDNGTGLGLAICYSIAARQNARIDYMTGSEGTTFNVCFPRPVEQISLFQ